MLRADRVTIPAAVEIQLKRSAAFVDNILEFACEDLIGFQRPFAATFAFTAPIVMAFAFSIGSIMPLVQIAASYFLISFAGFYLIGRTEWTFIVNKFKVQLNQKRRANADLRCGFGEQNLLTLTRAPRFFEYQRGVLAFVELGDLKHCFLISRIRPQMFDGRFISAESWNGGCGVGSACRSPEIS